MQTVIFAMFVIGILLILRGHGKNYFLGKKTKKGSAAV